MRRIAVQWLWFLLFPKWPVTFSFTLLILLTDHLGLEIHNHCVSCFLSPLSYAFPDLMAALPKLGALTLSPPDVEILPQVCLRTSLKWQCVCKVIMWVDSSVFAFRSNNWGLQLGCRQGTFGSVKYWVDELNVLKFHLFNCRGEIFTSAVKCVLFSFFSTLYIWQHSGLVYPLHAQGLEFSTLCISEFTLK